MIENGLIPEKILGAEYGRRVHFWNLHRRKHVQAIDFGDKYQLVQGRTHDDWSSARPRADV
jgi:hypothetical protein